MDNNEYFHSIGNGCKVVRRMQYAMEVPSAEELAAGATITGKYCHTHQIEICHCGWDWKHPHFHVEDVRANIKKNCFLCNKELKLSTKRYKLRGNACKMCDKRTNQVSLGKLTEEQADTLVEQRRVKYNFYEKNNIVSSSSVVSQ